MKIDLSWRTFSQVKLVTVRRVNYPITLALAAVGIAALASIPLVYIGVRAGGEELDTWVRLWSGQIPRILNNTVWLVAGVILCTSFIGISAAWLVERTDVPGRTVWRWLLALPLAVPGYVAAVCYLTVFRRGGLVDQFFMTYAGFGRAEAPLPDVSAFYFVTLVISLYSFPYVYLAVAAALRSMDYTLEEAALMAGRTRWSTFRDVTLPLLLPAVAAGTLLVGLYVLSDFGAVKLLRYQTFTTAIFSQFAGQVNRGAASILCIVLIILTLPLLFGEMRLHRRDLVYTRSTGWRPYRLLQLGRWRGVALGYLLLLASLSLFMPVAILTGLTLQGVLFPNQVDVLWRVGSENILSYGWNSLSLSIGAASLATLLAFVPTYLAVRYPSRFANGLLALSKTAFALPGLIIGLGFLLFFIQVTPLIYATVLALGLGLAFRLLPKSIAVLEPALQRVPSSLEQAARSMGCRPITAFWRVTLPLAAPGVVASWALVFITAMKELPVIILLSPPGYSTLTRRIWEAANDSVYTQAAPPALLLIGLTLLTLAMIYTVGRFGLDRVH